MGKTERVSERSREAETGGGGFRLSHSLVCGLAASSSRHGTDDTRFMEKDALVAMSKVLSG